MSEPKDEPIETSQQSSDPLLAWLVAVELIGRIVVVEMDLEEEADAAEEQWQHCDPGADRWGRQADLPVGPLGRSGSG